MRRKTSKRGYKKLVQQEAILRGVEISDLHKEIRMKWRRQSFISIKKINLEEAFFKPCIYYLMAGETIVYIGETESLMNRISQHLQENKKVFDGLSFVWFEGTKTERLKKESEEIKFHSPHYNIKHNIFKT